MDCDSGYMSKLIVIYMISEQIKTQIVSTTKLVVPWKNMKFSLEERSAPKLYANTYWSFKMYEFGYTEAITKTIR